MKKSALVYSKRSVQRERGKDQILHAKDGENPIVFDSLVVTRFCLSDDDDDESILKRKIFYAYTYAAF